MLGFYSLVIDRKGFTFQDHTEKQVPAFSDHLFFSGLSNPDKSFL